MPGKKQAVSAKLKSWQFTLAVISGVAVIVGGVGVFAYQSYTQAQISAVTAAESSIEFGEKSIKEITDLIDELELAIRNSEESLVNTKGQTLEEKEREALLAEIEKSKEIWVEQKTKLLELEAAVKSLKSQLASGGSPREALELLSSKATEIANSDWSKSANQIIALGEKITAVKTAQAAWEKERERISAEKAAAQVAAIERAEAAGRASKITETTSVAVPPSTSSAEIEPSLLSLTLTEVENYILSLATNVTFVWSENICEVGYICGKAVPAPAQNILDFLHASSDWGYAGAPTTPEHAHVFIVLDTAIADLYTSTAGGRSVLVHEAAHARQWLRYGKDIVSTSETQTRLLGIPAVEYMADCATIVKLNYSTGAYTRTCTPSELEAAATIW